MSNELALREIRRFLGNREAEVLSVSGRWGVGKTYAWVSELSAARREGRTPSLRYSYVSAFGLKSVKELREAIFQSTIRLDGPDIKPSLESLRENLSSIEGGLRLAEWGGRRITKAAGTLLSLVPWAGSAGELVLPAATLLIKDQLVCIDDIERTGSGLEVGELLGLVSQLKEERNCKIILLLNEEGMKDEKSNYRRYLEKVVDQAVIFEPTPSESCVIALPNNDALSVALRDRAMSLGITNIRIVKRIRRFIDHIEPMMVDWHQETINQAIQSIALFGWSIFEPELAPDIESIRDYNRYIGLVLSDNQPSDAQARMNQLLTSYGFGGVDDFDEVLIDGLKRGGFDQARLVQEAKGLSQRFANAEARAAVSRPWDIYGGSFEENQSQIAEAVLQAVADHGSLITPSEINGFFDLLCDLGRVDDARKALQMYMTLQDDKPREFFEPSSHPSFFRQSNPEVREAFESALAERPLVRDPTEVIAGIETNSGWNPEDIEFLASLTEDQLFEIFKSAKDTQLRIMLKGALRFVGSTGGPASYAQFGNRVKSALERIAAESELNAMRLRPYLGSNSE